MDVMDGLLDRRKRVYAVKQQANGAENFKLWRPQGHVMDRPCHHLGVCLAIYHGFQ